MTTTIIVPEMQRKRVGPFELDFEGNISNGGALGKFIFPLQLTGNITSLSGYANRVTFSLSFEGTLNSEVVYKRDTVVWTSRIGAEENVDLFPQFEKSTVTDDTGDAQELRNFSWGGYVYALKKLGNNVAVYGENGATLLTPYENGLWGSKPLLYQGLKGKNALTGNDQVHYCIDKIGRLHLIQAGGKVDVIDYSEYLSNLNVSVVMNYDERWDIVHINDGTLSFTYTSSGLGGGYSNLTGCGYKGGEFFVVAPGVIAVDPLSFITGPLDFGVRTEKTLYEVDAGISLVNDLYLAVDYRWSKADPWTSSPWVKANIEGRAPFWITAIEFRIKGKLLTYEETALDYSNVKGKYIDSKKIGGTE